jgi:hypothetical protein
MTSSQNPWAIAYFESPQRLGISLFVPDIEWCAACWRFPQLLPWEHGGDHG